MLAGLVVVVGLDLHHRLLRLLRERGLVLLGYRRLLLLLLLEVCLRFALLGLMDLLLLVGGSLRLRSLQDLRPNWELLLHDRLLVVLWRVPLLIMEGRRLRVGVSRRPPLHDARRSRRALARGASVWRRAKIVRLRLRLRLRLLRLRVHSREEGLRLRPGRRGLRRRRVRVRPGRPVPGGRALMLLVHGRRRAGQGLPNGERAELVVQLA